MAASSRAAIEEMPFGLPVPVEEAT